MNHRSHRLIACVLAAAALGACGGTPDDEAASEGQGSAATSTPEPDAGTGPRCTTPTGYTLSFSGYDSETLTLSLGSRTITLHGGNVAFRKRRYQDATISVEVYKGLGEYGAFIFDAAGKSLGTCTLK